MTNLRARRAQDPLFDPARTMSENLRLSAVYHKFLTDFSWLIGLLVRCGIYAPRYPAYPIETPDQDENTIRQMLLLLKRRDT